MQHKLTMGLVNGLFGSRNLIWNGDHKVAEAFGLSWGQFMILRALRVSENARPLVPKELSAITQSSSSGIATMLKALEKQSLIDRTPNPQDGRSILVTLTQEGHAMFEKITQSLLETNTTLFHDILPLNELDSVVTR